MPRTNCVPRSFSKVRRRRGPNCEEASVSDTIVTEKTTPATVMVEPAIVASTVRAPSGPPAQIHPVARTHFALMRVSTWTVRKESAVAAAASRVGMNQ